MHNKAVFFILLGTIVVLMCILKLYKISVVKKVIVYRAVCTSMVSVMQVLLYFLLISATGTIQDEKNPIMRGILVVLLAYTAIEGSVYLFGGFFKEIFQLKVSDSKKSGWFWLILFDVFVLLLMAGAFLNYAVILLFPGGFNLGDLPRNWYLTGFESIHYTFSLITTSGSPNLVASHPITKVLEMIEMLVFYLVYGCWLTNLMSND